MLHRLLLLGRGVPTANELMICDERRARYHAIPWIGRTSLALATLLTMLAWKVERPAVVLAVGLNLLDALFGRWTFQQMYVGGMPGLCGHGLTVLRRYLLPALNVATVLALVTDHLALRWGATLIGGSIVAVMFAFGVTIDLFFVPYSRGLAVQARTIFEEHVGAVTPITRGFCAGVARGFCRRRTLPMDGARTFEDDPLRFEVARQFQDHYEVVKAEVVRAMRDHPDLFSADYGYSENATGQWKSLNLIHHPGYAISAEQERLYERACRHLPHTMDLIRTLGEDDQIAGEAFLSILRPGATLPAHRDGVAGTRTLHLGLLVPPGCALTVGDDAYAWKEGECVVFDPSFVHSACNTSREPRVVLLADIYDPEWAPAERKALKAFKIWRGKLDAMGMVKVTARGMMARFTGR